MKILFMCVANSARSQMAEGLAKKMFPDFQIQSAGSQPARVNPLAIEAMKEIEIDLSGHFSKSVEDLEPDFVKDLDFVITLCAEEVCPGIISKAKKLHWPTSDPAGHNELSSDKRLQLFREARDSISAKLQHFKHEMKI